MPDALQELLAQAFKRQQETGSSIFGALGTPTYPTPPARPPGFEPDVPVLGSPELARLVWALTNEDPTLKRIVGSVSAGPTPGVSRTLTKSGLQPEDFDKTTLRGFFSTADESGDVFIDPRLPNPDEPDLDGATLIQTLIHELAHAKGADELQARQAQTTKETRQKYPALLAITRRR